MVARNTHIKGLKKRYDQINIQSKNNINKQINKKKRQRNRQTDRGGEHLAERTVIADVPKASITSYRLRLPADVSDDAAGAGAEPSSRGRLERGFLRLTS